MECPKCHTIISDRETVCPKCHKVLLLECPNCHSLEETSTCTNCGYKILIKCSKCGRINPAINDLCVKCGFPTKSSLALQECESDELASIIIKFNNLKKIRRLLKSKDLYEKFFFKLKNLVLAHVRNAEGLFITYGDTFVLNFNKELSLPTSANKAVRFALKLANSFTQINLNVIEELRVPLGLSIAIVRKKAEDLQEFREYENNVKLLNVKKDIKKYLKGTQITLDQYIWDEVSRDYKTDSLYSLEENGRAIMFYEIVLDSYILPPDTEKTSDFAAKQRIINKSSKKDNETQDMYSFKVFDINAKCSFDTSNAVSIKEKLKAMDFDSKAKILAIRSKAEYSPDVNDIIEVCEAKGLKTLTITCTEEMNYEPWGFFSKLFKSFYKIPFLNNSGMEGSFRYPEAFKPLYDLCMEKPLQASSPEDARFAYIDLWNKFLSVLSGYIIIVDGFRNLDDTSIQTLVLYFNKFKNVKPNFIFITDEGVSVHSKIKELLRTDKYTELKLLKSSFSNCLSTIKGDASDFIGSFYFEKIQENFNGSYLYFKYAMKYLKEMSVLIDFENKLLVKASKSVVVPADLPALYKARMKYFGKNQEISFIIAYSAMLYPGLDLKTLGLLGIKDLAANVKILIDSGLARIENDNLLINNYSIFRDIIASALRKEAEIMLSNNIVSKVGSRLGSAHSAFIKGKQDAFAEEYALLCKNADFALATGDYDSYLKNCLGFLSLIESVDSVIPPEEIASRKDEIYNSILKYLYNYAPVKIYFIEQILSNDAISKNDDKKIVRLSNMMLQGALLSSYYAEASGLLHNILSRMQNPILIVDGAVNSKFLLLSLVNMEILYNLGNFRECAELANEILSVLRVEIIEKIKPAGFSVNSFVSHILDTMRFAAFSKLYLMDDSLESFFEQVKMALDTELPDRDCILAIRDFLAGKVYNTGVVEEYSAFSKMVFLILQEISSLSVNKDYGKFAQNIFQAKLLAEDIYQTEIKYFCDLLIAYAYSKIGIKEKAEFIYKDVLKSAETSAMFNIIMIAKYFLIKLEKDSKKAMLMINDALSMLQKQKNQAVILYVLFEKLYIDIALENELPASIIANEEQKLYAYGESLKAILG